MPTIPARDIPVAIRDVLANKAFSMMDSTGVTRHYKVGDPVDVTHLRDHKVAQLLSQRMLIPGPSFMEQDQPAPVEEPVPAVESEVENREEELEEV